MDDREKNPQERAETSRGAEPDLPPAPRVPGEDLPPPPGVDDEDRPPPPGVPEADLAGPPDVPDAELPPPPEVPEEELSSPPPVPEEDLPPPPRVQKEELPSTPQPASEADIPPPPSVPPAELPTPPEAPDQKLPSPPKEEPSSPKRATVEERAPASGAPKVRRRAGSQAEGPREPSNANAPVADPQQQRGRQGSGLRRGLVAALAGLLITALLVFLVRRANRRDSGGATFVWRLR